MKISELPELPAQAVDPITVVASGGGTYRAPYGTGGGGGFLPGQPIAAYGPKAIIDGYTGSGYANNSGVITWLDQVSGADAVASGTGPTWSDGIVFDGASNLAAAVFLNQPVNFSVYVRADVQSSTRGQLIANGSGTANKGWALGFGGGTTHESVGGDCRLLIQGRAWGNAVSYHSQHRIFTVIRRNSVAMDIALGSAPTSRSANTSEHTPIDSFLIGGELVGTNLNRYLAAGNKIIAIAAYNYDTEAAGRHSKIVSFLSEL